MMNSRILTACFCVMLMVGALGLTGCSTAPKQQDRATFIADSRAATDWFERNVTGLDAQIAGSSGYVVFPEVAQWGILIGGGKFGRGLVCEPDGTQVGWAAVNTGSIGLQAGVQGFKMMLVLQNEETMAKFKANQWSGGVAAIAVVAERGGSAAANFDNGVAIYQGANTGLMAGVNIGLDYIRYEPDW